MRFKYSILYVENVQKTIDFYCRAFGLKAGFVHETGDYGELVTGSTTLAFSSRSLMKNLGKNPGMPNPDAPIFEIAFETDDVKTALTNAISAGAIPVQDLRQEDWGQLTAYVRDHDGFLIEICSPVKVQP